MAMALKCVYVSHANKHMHKALHAQKSTDASIVGVLLLTSERNLFAKYEFFARFTATWPAVVECYIVT